MKKLDALLIARVFAPLAWFIERLTGLNNFWQAFYLHQISPILLVGHDLSTWVTTTPHEFPWLAAFLWWPLWAFLCLLRMQVCRKMAEDADKRPDTTTTTPPELVATTFFWRTLFLFTFFPFDLVAFLLFLFQAPWPWVLGAPSLFWFSLTTLAFYLAAVPRPPASKRRQEKPSMWSRLVLQT